MLPLEAQIVANYIWRCFKNVIWYAQIFNINSAVQSSIARARVIVRARDRHTSIYREMEMNDSLLEYHGKFKWQAKYSYHEFTGILFGECCINYLWDFYHFVSRIQFRFLSHAIYMLLSILTSWLMSLAGDTQLSSITGQGSSSFCCASLLLFFFRFWLFWHSSSSCWLRSLFLSVVAGETNVKRAHITHTHRHT